MLIPLTNSKAGQASIWEGESLSGALRRICPLFCKADACFSCPECRKVLGGRHCDVTVLDWGEDKEITVDSVREFRSDAFVRPFEGDYKVYIIVNAQNLNTSAQNALLKLLEEPPGYCVFVLLTDSAEALLPTVRSRCSLHRAAERLPEPDQASADWSRRVIQALYKNDELELARACMSKASRAELPGYLTALSVGLLELLKGPPGAISSGALSNMLEAVKNIYESLEYNAGADAVCGLLCVRLWEAYH